MLLGECILSNDWTDGIDLPFYAIVMVRFISRNSHWSHFAGESTDALQTSGLSAFTASKSYDFILAAALLFSAAASAAVA